MIRSNQELVDYMIASGVLYTPALIIAFRRCDRMLFIPEELYTEAYGDYPLSIGMGQTISQPTTVAIMLELLQPKAGNNILDIGSGSGWTTALLASVVGDEGLVEGVERVPSLVEYGKISLKKAHVENATIDFANPSVLGKPGHLYDRILVSASANELPITLIEQLNAGGILVIPILKSVWRFTKREDGKISSYELPGFRFVPLITSQ